MDISFLCKQMNLLYRIDEYIAHQQLLTKGTRVVVGLSGGADSVALLAILVELRYKCIACHCNFMLRGDESVRDRNHAYSIAQQMGVEYVETTFDTIGYAQEKGISIEMAARELRYRWFEEMRQEHNAEAIAVAHHRDDNAETVLLNLTRGTGLAGLTGMKSRNGYVVRPLLCVSRAELLQYLANKHLTYVTDSTNLEAIYTRNKLRLEVIPQLREINSAFDTCFERTISYLRDSEKFYRDSIEQWKERVCTTVEQELYVDINKLHLSPAPSTLLFEILSPMGFNATQIEAMSNKELPSGRQFLSTTHRALSHRDTLIISAMGQQPDNSILATWQQGDTDSKHNIVLSYHNANGYEIPRNKNIACYDADKIVFPLVLRHWRQGDSFIPFGMHGRKKVSDYFSDHKFSIVRKEKALLLCDSEKILWIVGERAGNEARITDKTQNILQVMIEL